MTVINGKLVENLIPVEKQVDGNKFSVLSEVKESKEKTLQQLFEDSQIFFQQPHFGQIMTEIIGPMVSQAQKKTEEYFLDHMGKDIHQHIDSVKTELMKEIGVLIEKQDEIVSDISLIESHCEKHSDDIATLTGIVQSSPHLFESGSVDVMELLEGKRRKDFGYEKGNNDFQLVQDKDTGRHYYYKSNEMHNKFGTNYDEQITPNAYKKAEVFATDMYGKYGEDFSQSLNEVEQQELNSIFDQANDEYLQFREVVNKLPRQYVSKSRKQKRTRGGKKKFNGGYKNEALVNSTGVNEDTVVPKKIRGPFCYKCGSSDHKSTECNKRQSVPSKKLDIARYQKGVGQEKMEAILQAPGHKLRRSAQLCRNGEVLCGCFNYHGRVTTVTHVFEINARDFAIKDNDASFVLEGWSYLYNGVRFDIPNGTYHARVNDQLCETNISAAGLPSIGDPDEVVLGSAVAFESMIDQRVTTSTVLGQWNNKNVWKAKYNAVEGDCGSLVVSKDKVIGFHRGSQGEFNLFQGFFREYSGEGLCPTVIQPIKH